MSRAHVNEITRLLRFQKMPSVQEIKLKLGMIVAIEIRVIVIQKNSKHFAFSIIGKSFPYPNGYILQAEQIK